MYACQHVSDAEGDRRIDLYRVDKGDQEVEKVREFEMHNIHDEDLRMKLAL